MTESIKLTAPPPVPTVTPAQAQKGITQEMLSQAFRIALAHVSDRYDLLDFVSYIPRRAKVGGKWVTTDVGAYMKVDGRLVALGGLEATGEQVGLITHINAEAVTLKVPWYNAEGLRINTLLIPPRAAVAVLYNLETRNILRTGTAKVGGSAGAAKTCPYEDAETSAVGRVLGFAGFGLIGTGVATAEEMAKSKQAGNTKKKPAKKKKAPATNGGFADLAALRSWVGEAMQKLAAVPNDQPPDDRLRNNLIGVLVKGGLDEDCLSALVEVIWPDHRELTQRKAMVLINLIGRRTWEADKALLWDAAKLARKGGE